MQDAFSLIEFDISSMISTIAIYTWTIFLEFIKEFIVERNIKGGEI